MPTMDTAAMNFRGVIKDRRGLWQTKTRVHGIYRALARFASPVVAARMYDVACLAIHGDQAELNFAKEDYAEHLATIQQLDVDSCDWVDTARQLAMAIASSHTAPPTESGGAVGDEDAAMLDDAIRSAQAALAAPVLGVKEVDAGWEVAIPMRATTLVVGVFKQKLEAALIRDLAVIRMQGFTAPTLNLEKAMYLEHVMSIAEINMAEADWPARLAQLARRIMQTKGATSPVTMADVVVGVKARRTVLRANLVEYETFLSHAAPVVEAIEGVQVRKHAAEAEELALRDQLAQIVARLADNGCGPEEKLELARQLHAKSSDLKRVCGERSENQRRVESAKKMRVFLDKERDNVKALLGTVQV